MVCTCVHYLQRPTLRHRLWSGIFVFHYAVGKVRALGKKAAVGKKGMQLNSLSSRPSQSRVYVWERTGTEANSYILLCLCRESSC